MGILMDEWNNFITYRSNGILVCILLFIFLISIVGDHKKKEVVDKEKAVTVEQYYKYGAEDIYRNYDEGNINIREYYWLYNRLDSLSAVESVYQFAPVIPDDVQEKSDMKLFKTIQQVILIILFIMAFPVGLIFGYINAYNYKPKTKREIKLIEYLVIYGVIVKILFIIGFILLIIVGIVVS